jgi:DNA-binding CsgD family transcriptional regulator
MLERSIAPQEEVAPSRIIDQLRLPIFLVQNDSTIRYSNAAGLSALKDGDAFKKTDRTLSAISPTDSARLKSAIAGVCSTGQRETLMVADIKNRRPHIVTIVPFSEEHTERNAGALVLVQKCEPSDEVFAGSVRQLFRLSAAEISIAAALVSGADIEQIAEMRNAKVTTVRTQIAAMMLKTRTRRQGELVAVFSRLSTLP